VNGSDDKPGLLVKISGAIIPLPLTTTPLPTHQFLLNKFIPTLMVNHI